MKFYLVRWFDTCGQIHDNLVVSETENITEVLFKLHNVITPVTVLLKTEISRQKAWMEKDNYKILSIDPYIQWGLDRICNVCHQFKPDSEFVLSNIEGSICADQCYPKISGYTLEEARYYAS